MLLSFPKTVFARTASALNKVASWVETHPEKSAAWAAVVATIVSTIAIVASAFSYANTYSKERNESTEKRLREMAACFEVLENGERRYRLIDFTTFKPTYEKYIEGEIDARESAYLYVLPDISENNIQPRFYLGTLTYSKQVRERPVQLTIHKTDDNGQPQLEKRIQNQTYEVSVPVRGRPSVSLDAFGCTDCDSINRLEAHLAAKRFEASLSGYTTASQNIRLARSGIDFGDIALADKQLKTALEKLIQVDSEIQIALVKEEAGKTYMLLGNKVEGQKLIDESKVFWSVKKQPSQIGRLHEIIEWEAQFACSRGNEGECLMRLAEMATVIQSYSMGVPQVTRMIEDAYASCLAILCSYGEPDPFLPVPPEHSSFVEGNGWVPTIQYFRSDEYRKMMSSEEAEGGN